MNAHEIGLSAMLLGAGRAKKDDVIDPSAGIVLHKKIGDSVSAGEPLLTMHYSGRCRDINAVKDKLRAAVHIGPSAAKPPLIYKIITD